MLKYFIAFFIPLFLSASENHEDLQWVDQEIAAIKPPRKGMESNLISKIEDPFMVQLLLNRPPEDEKIKTPLQTYPVMSETIKEDFTLQAIFNSNKALIDGTWVHPGDKVYGYAVKSIGKDYVILMRNGKRVTLTLNPANENIKIKVR